MAGSTVGTSLGQHPFEIQDTFTWGDLSHAGGSGAEQARHSWSINGVSTSPEAHFFKARMNASKERGKFTLVISVMLLPYNFLVYSDTSSLCAVKSGDLVTLVMAHLEGLLGMPLAERVIRRYGGKMLEWLESVSAIYEEEEAQ